MPQPSNFKPAQTRPSAQPRFVSVVFLLTVLVLLLSTTGCATNSPPPSVYCPTPPAIPSVSTELPPVSLSESVRLDLLKWQERLTGLLEK